MGTLSGRVRGVVAAMAVGGRAERQGMGSWRWRIRGRRIVVENCMVAK